MMKTFHPVVNLFFLACCVLCGVTTALAKTPIELESKLLIPSLTVHANPENPVNSDFAVIDLHLAVKVWTLLGHPVFMCTGWWDIKSVRVAGATFYGVGGYSNQLPEAVMDKIRIWDSRFQVPIQSEGNGWDINLQCGAGEFWKAGLQRPSFNVPDSVGWDRLFHRAYVGVPGVVNDSVVDFFARPLSAQTAKAIMTDSQARIVTHASGWQEFNHANVLALKLDLGAVYGWMNKEVEAKQDTLKNTLVKQKKERPRSLDEMFNAVDTQQKLAAAKKQKALVAVFENKTAPTLKQSQNSFSEKLKNKRCAGVALSPNDSMSLPGYVNQQQVATADCLAVKNLMPKQDGQSRLWGYVTDSGDWHIKPQFQYAKPFGDGLAPVQPKDQQKFGYIDNSGRWVIPAKYRFADPFKNQRAIVSDKAGQYGVIDTADRIIIPIKWYTIQPSYGDHYLVETKPIEKVLSSESVRIACRVNKYKQGWKTIRVKTTERSYQYGELDRNNRWVKPLKTERSVKEGKRWPGMTNC